MDDASTIYRRRPRKIYKSNLKRFYNLDKGIAKSFNRVLYPKFLVYMIRKIFSVFCNTGFEKYSDPYDYNEDQKLLFPEIIIDACLFRLKHRGFWSGRNKAKDKGKLYQAINTVAKMFGGVGNVKDRPTGLAWEVDGLISLKYDNLSPGEKAQLCAKIGQQIADEIVLLHKKYRIQKDGTVSGKGWNIYSSRSMLALAAAIYQDALGLKLDPDVIKPGRVSEVRHTLPNNVSGYRSRFLDYIDPPFNLIGWISIAAIGTTALFLSITLIDHFLNNTALILKTNIENVIIIYAATIIIGVVLLFSRKARTVAGILAIFAISAIATFYPQQSLNISIISLKSMAIFLVAIFAMRILFGTFRFFFRNTVENMRLSSNSRARKVTFNRMLEYNRRYGQA